MILTAAFIGLCAVLMLRAMRRRDTSSSELAPFEQDLLSLERGQVHSTRSAAVAALHNYARAKPADRRQ
jgi:hypothetical protein